MSSTTDIATPFLSESIPISPSNATIAAVIFTLILAHIIYCTSPMRLSHNLFTAIDEAEKAYLDAIEAGVLYGSDVKTELRLARLLIKVAKTREASLRNSLSSWQSLRQYFQGRPLTILECIWEARELKTNIEILKEGQLRKLNPLQVGTATRTISVWRRPSSSSRIYKCQH